VESLPGSGDVACIKRGTGKTWETLRAPAAVTGRSDRGIAQAARRCKETTQLFTVSGIVSRKGVFLKSPVR